MSAPDCWLVLMFAPVCYRLLPFAAVLLLIAAVCCLLQLAASNKFKLEVGDVSTAFLQGDKTEPDRDVYLEPTADLRTRLQMTKEHVLKLTGSVYGLRNAPRAWYLRVRKDLEAQGWRCHQLDQCVFFYMMTTS